MWLLTDRFDRCDPLIDPLSYPLLPLIPASLMHGKRARTASSPPQYERVIWVEQKTARGSKITARVSNSPKTPKVRKLATPHSKKRRLEALNTTPVNSGAGDDNTPNPFIPMNLKAKSGKVCIVIYKVTGVAGIYPSLASR